MRKIFIFAICLIASFIAFAKDIPLNVTETEWGYEISNVDAKGKHICKKYIDSFIGDNVTLVFKTNADSFSPETFAYKIVYDNLANSVYLSGTQILAVSKFEIPISNYDSILVISSKGKISECNAFCVTKDSSLKLNVSEIDHNAETSMSLLVKKYVDEKERAEAEKKAEEEARIAAEKKAKEEQEAAEKRAKDEKAKKFAKGYVYHGIDEEPSNRNLFANGALETKHAYFVSGVIISKYSNDVVSVILSFFRAEDNILVKYVDQKTKGEVVGASKTGFGNMPVTIVVAGGDNATHTPVILGLVK